MTRRKSTIKSGKKMKVKRVESATARSKLGSDVLMPKWYRYMKLGRMITAKSAIKVRSRYGGLSRSRRRWRMVPDGSAIVESTVSNRVIFLT